MEKSEIAKQTQWKSKYLTQFSPMSYFYTP